MNTIVNSLLNYSTFFTRNDLQPLTNPQIKKILAITTIAFTCLAAAVYIGMRCFKAKKLGEDLTLKSPSEESKKLDMPPKNPVEEFKEKQIEFKQQFNKAKTVSEKFTICEKFSSAIKKIKKNCFTFNTSENKEIIKVAEELRLNMIIDMDKIDSSSEELNLMQKGNLKFNKVFIETLVKTEEAIVAKGKAAAEAHANRTKLSQRFYSKDTSDTTYEVDRKKNAQNCIQLENDFQLKFQTFLKELEEKFEYLIENSELSDCSEKVYVNLKEKLLKLTQATLEPGVEYGIM